MHRMGRFFAADFYGYRHLTHNQPMEAKMKKIILSALLVLTPFAVANFAYSQGKTESDCQQTIQNNCTKCHNTDRICHELSEADANWPKIVKEMGEKGKLSKEVQDNVLNCLTKSDDPKKLVCKKK